MDRIEFNIKKHFAKFKTPDTGNSNNNVIEIPILILNLNLTKILCRIKYLAIDW